MSADLFATIREGVAPHPCTRRYGCPTCKEAEAALVSLEERLRQAEKTLRFYAEQRNYANGAGGDPACPTHGGRTCGLHHRDSWDSGYPGARARAYFAAVSGSEGA